MRFNTNSIFRNFITGNDRFSDNEELKYINNESSQFDFNLTTLNDDIDKLSTVGDKFQLADAQASTIIRKRFVLDLENPDFGQRFCQTVLHSPVIVIFQDGYKRWFQTR